jgi:hypothetical protein
VFYWRRAGREADMTWIFLMMLGMIGGSIVVELVLPARIKQALGNAICWSMMAVTMTTLGLCTLGLLYVTATNYIIPFFTA